MLVGQSRLKYLKNFYTDYPEILYKLLSHQPAILCVFIVSANVSMLISLPKMVNMSKLSAHYIKMTALSL